MLRRDLRKIYRSFAPEETGNESLVEELLAARPSAGEIEGKKWKPKGQTRVHLTRTLAVLLVLAIAFGAAWYLGLVDRASIALTAYLAQREQEQSQVQSDAPETLPGDTEDAAEQTVQEAYKELVAKYRTAIRENWDATACIEGDISIMVTFLTEPEQLSCAKMDLDEDGVPELLLTDGNVIYDLYTFAEGKTVHVLSGAERNAWHLTEDRMLINIGSNSAASTVYGFYHYSKGNLIVDQKVFFDAGVDPDNPWFRGFAEVESAEPISEAEANEILDSYPKASILGVPITEYA